MNSPISISWLTRFTQTYVVAVVLPEQFHSSLLDAANDYNRYGALTTLTNTVDQYLYYEDIPEDMKNEADPVADITQDPFVVMISRFR